MDKSITKNIIIGVLGILLGLSLCYIGYDKLINKENIKEETNPNQEENNTNDEIDKIDEDNQEDSNSSQEDSLENPNTNQEELPPASETEENCGSKCYGGISTNGLNAIKWFYNNNKLLDIAQLNGFDNFDIEGQDLENYFSFIVAYMMVTDKTIKEEELKKVLLKYFEIKDINNILEQLKNYKVKENNFITNFEYNEGMFSLEYLITEYDYNYKVISYNENDNSNEISLNILKCDAYDEMKCTDAKTLTLSNTSNEFKIKKIENY